MRASNSNFKTHATSPAGGHSNETCLRRGSLGAKAKYTRQGMGAIPRMIVEIHSFVALV
jgi:hypothetical protein